MPRRRPNDPLGVSDNPTVVTDPEREKAVLEEFERRLAYLAASYRFGKKLGLDDLSFNQSLVRLRKAVGRPKVPGRGESRLNPRVESLISHRARELAGLDAGEALTSRHERFVQQAAAEIANKVRPERGRPAHNLLRHHVEGLMALIQETCGTPVRALRDKNSVYDPQLAEGASRTIETTFEVLEPGASKTLLANIVRDARRRYAGKPMRFRDFFPFYGGTLDPQTLAPVPGPGHRLEHFELGAPIYCP